MEIQMKKILVIVFLLALISLQRCAGTYGGMKVLPEREDDKVMVLGCILIENINQRFAFVNWDLPVKVVILGRSEGGAINHYETYSDEYGYYCFPNLPRGSYILKGFIFQEPGAKPEIIVNTWRSVDSKFYRMRHPERGFDYTSGWFPPNSQGKIIDQGINWFGLRAPAVADISEEYIGETLYSVYFESLKAKRIWEQGFPYTRVEPVEYFKKKFPDSGWWQE